MEGIQQAANLILQSHYAVALTGAGISTPSGIPDFRSPGSGLWEKYNPMVVASIDSFCHNPMRFYDWITPLAEKLLAAQPNPAHHALVQLEQLGILKSVITQNIDLLHSKAGSKTVYEVHGHIRTATCMRCHYRIRGEEVLNRLLQAAGANLKAKEQLVRCPQCDGIIKPDVVLFGEALPMRVIRAATTETTRCDLLLVAGSSLEVYPVADLPRQASANGAKLIIIDYEATTYDRMANVAIHGDVAEVLPKILEAVEAKHHDR